MLELELELALELELELELALARRRQDAEVQSKQPRIHIRRARSSRSHSGASLNRKALALTTTTMISVFRGRTDRAQLQPVCAKDRTQWRHGGSVCAFPVGATDHVKRTRAAWPPQLIRAAPPLQS